jgi:acetyl esterase/lipase
MKIEQKPSYQPITITLETAQEARDFIGLIDQVDACRGSEWTPDELTRNQNNMLTEISNIFTDKIGIR